MNSIICRLASLLLLLSGAAPSLAAPERELPDQFEVTFTLEVVGATVARTRWSLSPGNDGGYIYESHTEVVGVLSLIHKDSVFERSEWVYTEQWLRPHAYRYKRIGRKARDISIVFDWEESIAHHDSPSGPWQMPVPDGTMDKLTYLLALMRDLGRGKRSVEYMVADGGELERYTLIGIGEERIETALGTFDTIVVRRERANKKRETTFWCASALNFLPVQMLHEEHDGTSVTFHIESLSGIERRGS